MKTIVFTNESKIEAGLRLIVTSGYVEYTSEKGVYRIPDHVAALLAKAGIPYREQSNSGQVTRTN